jgi:hypothetical protein
MGYIINLGTGIIAQNYIAVLLRHLSRCPRYGRNSFGNVSDPPNPVPHTMYNPMDDTVLARYNPRAQFPGTQGALYICKTSYDLVHGRALFGVFLNHIVHERLHELKTISAFAFMDERITLIRSQ